MDNLNTIQLVYAAICIALALVKQGYIFMKNGKDNYTRTELKEIAHPVIGCFTADNKNYGMQRLACS
jgi:hypothetical protein